MDSQGPFLTIRIGKLVKNERERRGLSFTQTAEECGLPEDVLSKIESGHKALSTKELNSVASFLHTKPEELIKTGPKNASEIKFRINCRVKNQGTIVTIEKAQRLFREMVTQDTLRNNYE